MIFLILGFVACGLLNWGYAYTLAFSAIVLACPVLRRRQVTLNFILSADFWLLAAFGLSFVLLTGLEMEKVQNYFLLPLMAYALGWCAFEQGGRNTAAVRDSILAIALGFGSHACLNCFVNLESSRYQLIDFWTGSFRTATGSGFLCTMLFSLAAYSLFLERRKWMKFLLLSVTALCLCYVFILGTRTQLFILALTLCLGVLLLILERNSARWTLRFLLGAVCLMALAIAVFRADFLGLGSLLAQSNFLHRFTAQDSLFQSDLQRLSDFAIGLKTLYDHPFGSDLPGYFHNLWLDVGRMSGILPVALLLCYHIRAMAHAVCVFRNRKADISLRYMVLPLFCGVMAYFFVEPVLEGAPDFFLAFCIINGLVDAWRAHKKWNE